MEGFYPNNTVLQRALLHEGSQKIRGEKRGEIGQKTPLCCKGEEGEEEGSLNCSLQCALPPRLGWEEGR